jgi:hypothetical protein
MPFSPAGLSIWLKLEENLNAITALLTSGDLRLVNYPAGGETVLRTHSRSVTRLEIGLAPILPESRD